MSPREHTTACFVHAACAPPPGQARGRAWGGASPAQRYRIEGFARAVCSLGLAPASVVIAELHSAWVESLGDGANDCREDDFRSIDDGLELPCIPVRLPRAPVYPGSST